MTLTAQDLQIPAADFTIEITAGSVKPTMKAVGGKSADLWKVPPKQLHVLPGYNLRVRTPKYLAHLERITDSIMRDGFRVNKPLAGFVREEVINGKTISTVVVTAGHTRLEATLKAIKRGKKIDLLPIVIDQDNADLVHLTFDAARDNEQMPHTPIELSILVQRMLREKLTESEIAKRAGFTAQYVKDLLVLAEAPEPIRQMVILDEVAATLAVEQIRKHGDGAYEVLQQSLKRVQAAGGTRVTKKHTVGAKFGSYMKRSAPVLFDVVTTVKGDPAYASLQPSVRDLIEELLKNADAAKAKDAEAIAASAPDGDRAKGEGEGESEGVAA